MRVHFVKILILVSLFVAGGAGYMLLTPSQHYAVDITAPSVVNFTKNFAGVIVPDQLMMIPDEPIMLSDGRIKSFKSLIKGEWALVNLWATWCAPCVTELPSLRDLQKQMPALKIIALSFDNNKDIVTLNDFMKKNKVEELTLAYDNALKIRRAITTRGLPTSLLVAPNGQVLLILEGHTEWTTPEALLFFETIMQQPKTLTKS